MKNLEAAVVASRRPGYFEYYAPPPATQQAIANNEIATRMKSVNKSQDALFEIENELAEASKKRTSEFAPQRPPEVKSLSDWFAHYGQPQRGEGNGPGWRTSVVSNPKIYGGTSHHMAFKTQAKIQKAGRLTR